MRSRSARFWLLILVGLSIRANAQDLPLQKRPIAQFIAPACEQIASRASSFPTEKISRATQYYTPMFAPGPDGKLKVVDRKSCLEVEGACLVGEYLYTTTYTEGLDRSKVEYKFGPGNGRDVKYNITNALDPCRTVAADQKSFYPKGTVLYIPAMKDKICPQSGKPVDGCFIVGDIGSAIKGPGRFDLFTGECAQYEKSGSYCKDPANPAFGVQQGTSFYVIQRDNEMAGQLRKEANSFVASDWR